MTLFAFLLMVTRIYAPFDQALALLSELFAAQTSASRMRSIMEEPLATAPRTSARTAMTWSLTTLPLAMAPARTAALARRSWRTRALWPARARSRPWWVPRAPASPPVPAWPRASGTPPRARCAWAASTLPGVDPEALLADYAVVFQDVLLFDDTVMGNIRLGRRDATDEEVLAAAHAANCDEFVGRMADGYRP